jgi:hypothetical protein
LPRIFERPPVVKAAKRVWRALALAAALGLSACASAAQVQPPIAEFATATDAAAMALKALDGATTARTNALALADAVKNPRRVRPMANACGMASPGCALELAPIPTDERPLPLAVSSLVPKSLKVMASLQAYAKALDEMAKADASADVEAGFGKAMSAAAAIATVVNPGAGTLLNSLNQPLTGTVVYVFGQYQNSLKLAALRKATAEADPVIGKAMQILSAEADLVRTATVARQEAEYNAAFKALDEGGLAGDVNEVLAAAAKLDAALSAKPALVFNKVATVHAKLTADLKDRSASFADVVAETQGLIDEAMTIQQVARTLEAANR